MERPFAAIVSDRTQANYELAVLRLHLAVGMAVADGMLDEREHSHLRRLAETIKVDADERVLLRGALDRLLADPPHLEALLRALVDRITTPAQAQVLVHDLKAIAHVDGAVDPREEGLLRLVCGALQIDLHSLYGDDERAATDVSSADLTLLVRKLLDL